MRSTPAAPRFSRTTCHARCSTSLRWMRSQSAWKRRFGDRLAARYSLTWSSRTLSCLAVLSPEGMRRSFRPRHSTDEAGPLPSPPVLLSCAAQAVLRAPPPPTRPGHDFTAHHRLYAPIASQANIRRPGAGEGFPSSRTDLPTVPLPLPREVLDRCTSRLFAASMAFAVNSPARLLPVPAHGASVTRRQDSLDVTDR